MGLATQNIIQPEILVIGATGKTGKRVYEKLTNCGFAVKAGSRQSEQPFDWNNQATWQTALKHIKKVYLTYYPDLAVPTAPQAIEDFCNMAIQSGVEHITLLSGRGEEAAQVCESIVQNSGLEWTIVRASWFNQNFSEGQFRDYIMSGTIALPVAQVTEAFVDIDDLADVVVASLTETGHSGKQYEVTGPELLSFEEIAAKFSKHLNKEISFIEISMEAFEKALDDVGVADDVIEMLLYLFGEVLDGRNEYLTHGIEEALGRKPKRFDEYIQSNINYFQG